MKDWVPACAGASGRNCVSSVQRLGDGFAVADLGTGSGAIALALYLGYLAWFVVGGPL